MPAATFTIGLISDTHGLMRPQALAALRGVDAILHAGDIGGTAILTALGEVAPVTAVRGNNDMGDWAWKIPETVTVSFGTVAVHMLHDLSQLDLDPTTTGIRVIVSGHSHRPLNRWDGKVLYINPGSAGPRRFTLPIAVAKLRLEADAIAEEMIELSI